MSRVFANHWNDYELLDAGNAKKLERWGKIITIRPDRNAYFKPGSPESEWKNLAHFEFTEHSANSGEWQELKAGTPREWQIKFQSVTLNLKLTRFKHIGVFPEQSYNWDFVSNHLNPGDRFLNLFGYTGAVSLVARSKGAAVFHCDSVKQIISWGKENMESSGLSDIHWILEDALKFAQREVKRGNKYRGICMDPPAFGLGANKERWKIEDKFSELLELAVSLAEPGGFIIANTYSPRLSITDIQATVSSLFPSKNAAVNKLCVKSVTGKVIEYGELTRLLT
ncbi:MAG: class I SAM-dependent methyltransferase [Bacteroidetes bacterium]|nr:class I SAM-dependent methyltransferase [Bacteroidota bacterium]